jgi:hypothetical protein
VLLRIIRKEEVLVVWFFYFKQKLRPGIHLLNSNSKYCMWVRLDCNFFGFEKDLYYGIIYLRSTEDRKSRDLYFEQLDNDIVKYRSMGDIVITGDFNARTSTTPDYIINDHYDKSDSHIPLPEMYVNDIPLFRNNVDTKCNQYGKLLLDVCCSHSLRILNGRLTGDLFGNLTYYSENNSNGASTIDYTIANVSVLDRFKFIHISEPDFLLSDHCIQSFGIRCEYIEHTETTSEFKPLYDRFEWNQDSEKKYQDMLLENTTQDRLCSYLTKSYSWDGVSVNQATNELTDIMINVADGSLKRKCKHKNKNKKKRKNLKLGFDTECYIMRKEMRSLGKAVRRNPYNLNLREKFVYQSRKYKKMLRKKEKEYREKILSNLCSLESTNPKQFWSLVNKLKTSDSNSEGSDIESDRWVEHFETLYNCTPDTSLDTDIANLENNSESNETLSKPFTISEIKKHIKFALK